MEKRINEISKEVISNMIELFKFKVKNKYIVLNNLDSSRTPAVQLLDSLKGSISEYFVEKELVKYVNIISYDEIRIDKHQYPDPFDFLIIDKKDNKDEIIKVLKTMIPKPNTYFTDENKKELKKYIKSILGKTIEVKSSRCSDDEDYKEKTMISYCLNKEDYFFYHKLKNHNNSLFIQNDKNIELNISLPFVLKNYFEKELKIKFYGKKVFDKKILNYLRKDKLMELFLSKSPFTQEQLEKGESISFDTYLSNLGMSTEEYLNENEYLKDIHINTFNYFDYDEIKDDFKTKDIFDIKVEDVLPYLPYKVLIAGFAFKYDFLNGNIGLNNKRVQALYHLVSVGEIIKDLSQLAYVPDFLIKKGDKEFYFNYNPETHEYFSSDNNMTLLMKQGQILDFDFVNKFKVDIIKDDKNFKNFEIEPKVLF